MTVWREWPRAQTACAVAALVLVIVSITATPAGAAVPASGGRVFHVAPDGSRSANGSSWQAAGTLTAIPRFIERAEPGDEIWIRGDAGEYHTTDIIPIVSGGTADAPIVVRGVAADGSDRATPVLAGQRAFPYDPQGNAGREVFRLLDGADHLRFENLSFTNQGNGAFRVGADISDLEIRTMQATNVRRFFENYPSGERRSATISGLRINDVAVYGFSKSAVRLGDDTHDVVMKNVLGDSQRQDRDSFAMGVHLLDTVHDVVLERVKMRNSHDTLTQTSYWNGDGFVAERDTYDVVFRDTVATGSTDAGYDLKGEADLIRATAEDNKRNFRFWGKASAYGCAGHSPHRRGGSGSQAQVWAGSGARVRLIGCSFSDDDANTVTLDVAESADVTALESTVTRHPSSALSHVDSSAKLRLVSLLASACPPPRTPDSGFADASDSPHKEAIDCVTQWEVARGQRSGRFNPDAAVTRGQMATFIVNVLRRSGADIPDQRQRSHFKDTEGTAHADSIRTLASVGIVDGFVDGSYRPNKKITRAQLATFLARMHHHIAREGLDDEGVDLFDDDNASVHEQSINRVAATGLAMGTSPAQYSPNRFVTRAQMARFISRSLGLLVETGTIPRP